MNRTVALFILVLAALCALLISLGTRKEATSPAPASASAQFSHFLILR